MHLSYGQTRLVRGRPPETPTVLRLLRFAQAPMPAKKPTHLLKASVIRIRITEDELGKIQQAADLSGVSVSAYVRNAALGHPMPKAPAPKINQDLFLELGRIGNNVNQIAHALNQFHGVYPDQAKITDAISDLWKGLQAIRRDLLR